MITKGCPVCGGQLLVKENFTKCIICDWMPSRDKWIQEKPTEIGMYIRSNPAFQRDLTFQKVYVGLDGSLVTRHPQNDSMKTVKISDMPKTFWWLKISLPPFWKNDNWEWGKE